MDSIRKNIFKNIEQGLSTIDGLNRVTFGSFSLANLKDYLPACWIMPEEEARDRVTHDGGAQESLALVIRVLVDEDFQDAGYHLEDMLAAVETQMLADPTRGGLAVDTEKRQTRWLFLDRDHPEAGADIDFLVTYFRHEADPAV